MLAKARGEVGWTRWDQVMECRSVNGYRNEPENAPWPR